MNPASRRLALLSALLVIAAPAATVPPADPSVIVRAEQAFAARVRQLGVRAGFLDWLAPTGVVFRPGPVMGHTSYEQQPLGWHGLLAWHPVRAAISSDGSLGWSTGPWTFRRDSTKQKADSYGDYLTVWRRQSDGSYKVALDCGVSHGDPWREETTVKFSNPVAGANLGSRPLAARQSLYQADASYARYAASEGVAGAIARYATEDMIALREGAQRLVGRATVHDSIAVREREANLVSNAQYISESGDLGYTYGSFVTGSPVIPDSAYYVHVWHRGVAATWRLALEVVMPVPKPKQK